MNIPINATVYCQEQDCGKTTCVIIDPISKEVTHIVVQEKGLVGLKRLVPTEIIYESTADQITLRCSLSEFSKFTLFIESHYIGGSDPILEYETSHYYFHPFVLPDYEEEYDHQPLLKEDENIPFGELGIHRGAAVYATDGKVGQVDEFLVSPQNNKISHLLFREGHLWGQKLVTIPVSEIDRIETDHVYLKLNKQAIEKLPVVPVKRFFP